MKVAKMLEFLKKNKRAEKVNFHCFEEKKFKIKLNTTQNIIENAENLLKTYSKAFE
jgi:hypothetical protein